MGHDHPHATPMAHADRAFAIGIVLNLAFVVVEAWFGWRAGSLALLADAAHNLGDVGGLVIAWAGLALSRLKPDERHTYGWRRGSIIASFLNALLLLVAMGSLAWEAGWRIGTPTDVDAITVMAVAGIGVLINFATAWLFMGDRRDLNIRGAFLHMAADGLVSLGVVISGALALWMGWNWLDPLASLLVAGVVVVATWSLLRRSLHLLFDGVPDGIDLEDIRRHLSALPGVAGVHHVHVWALATSENALTAHLVFAAGAESPDAILATANRELALHFGIRHATLQLESAAYAARCANPARPD